ncbi:hypothetical protein Tco_0657378 [Tanacetum coccineum]|uniref:Uncharacterized protein n=1 Tax=Tanacetum coccineum TaxID=301880 RepID=A0ABQ4XBL9_9ASTR
MSLPRITVSSDSDAESIGSSASLVVLSDTKAAVAVVPAIAPEIALETSPSPDYVPTSPDSETRPYNVSISFTPRDF